MRALIPVVNVLLMSNSDHWRGGLSTVGRARSQVLLLVQENAVQPQHALYCIPSPGSENAITLVYHIVDGCQAVPAVLVVCVVCRLPSKCLK